MQDCVDAEEGHLVLKMLPKAFSDKTPKAADYPTYELNMPNGWAEVIVALEKT